MDEKEKKRLAHRSNVYAAFDVGGKALVYVTAMLVGLITWNGQNLYESQEEAKRERRDIQMRLQAIESSRYTHSDAIKERQNITSEMMATRSLVADQIKELRLWVQENFPPEWLKEDIQEVKEDSKSLESKLDLILIELQKK